jgi:hypothetical protein
MISNTQLEIASLVNQQIHETLKEYLKSIDIKTLVTQAMSMAIDDAVDKVTLLSIEKITKERDIAMEISRHIENSAVQEIEAQSTNLVKSKLNEIDIKAIIATTVNNSLKFQINNFNFPDSSIPVKSINLNNFKFDGGMIEGGIIRNFNSVGIQDQSTSCQLTVIDGMIIVEGTTVSNEIKTKKLQVEDLTVSNVSITGTVNIGSHLKDSIASISQLVIDENKRKTWDIAKQSIQSDGRLLLDSNTLGPGVTNSNIRKLGLLQELKVQGDVKFSETMLISAQGKIGINTEEPVGALTVWDQDADLTIMKLSKKNMFIGSTRNGDITIGNDKQYQLTVRNNEVDIKTALRLMGLRISVSDTIPDHIGEFNEIVLVPSAKQNQPVAYICKGQNTWASLGILAQ